MHKNPPKIETCQLIGIKYPLFCPNTWGIRLGNTQQTTNSFIAQPLSKSPNFAGYRVVPVLGQGIPPSLTTHVANLTAVGTIFNVLCYGGVLSQDSNSSLHRRDNETYPTALKACLPI